jgi:hypothetical protein
MQTPERIIAQRRAGRTICVSTAIPLHQHARVSADAVAQQHGMRALGDAWLEISSQQAHTIAAAVLHRDLARGDEIMPMRTAQELATEFLDLAPEPHTYFTNGEWDLLASDDTLASEVSFDPLTEAAFNAGVVCVGEAVAAVLWVQDDE